MRKWTTGAMCVCVTSGSCRLLSKVTTTSLGLWKIFGSADTSLCFRLCACAFVFVLHTAMASFASVPAKGLPPKPPDKGSFPLDHFRECSDAKKTYMDCLKQHTMSTQVEECRKLSAAYLQCRMDACVPRTPPRLTPCVQPPPTRLQGADGEGGPLQVGLRRSGLSTAAGGVCESPGSA